MKTLFITFFFLFSFQTLHAASSENRSGKGVRFRLFANVGGWSSNFQQSVYGHETKVNSLIAGGIGYAIGLSIYRIYFEYPMTWLLPPYSENPKARDATYFTPMGINAGLILPFIPVEIYGGLEDGTYRLSGGLNPAYQGTAYKAGVAIYFKRHKVLHLGVRVEYRKMIMTDDDAGKLPSGYSTSADMAFIALTFGGR